MGLETSLFTISTHTSAISQNLASLLSLATFPTRWSSYTTGTLPHYDTKPKWKLEQSQDLRKGPYCLNPHAAANKSTAVAAAGSQRVVRNLKPQPQDSGTA